MGETLQTRKPTYKQLAHQDGWVNELSGLGDPNRDRRLAATPTASYKPLIVAEYELLWRSSDMAARAVETPADEMVRKFPCIIVAKDKEQGELLDAALQDINVKDKLREALRYARAYGGGAVFLGVNDRVGVDGLDQPLDETQVRSLDYLTVFDPEECRAIEWYDNPLAEKYGEPRIYEVTPRQFAGPEGVTTLGNRLAPIRVHETRLLCFKGPITTRMQRVRAQGWGDSILARIYEIVRDFDMVWDSSAFLVSDFAQAVFKMRGLADAIAGDAEGLVRKRIQQIDYSRSVARGVVIDADSEEFTREQTPISGLAEILDRWCNRMAAAARMPVTLLMGQSPAGLNATGDADIRWFYDQISSDQQTILRPALERIVRLVMLSKAGPTRGVEPEDWDLEFPPLWQMNDLERADIYFKNAQADVGYLEHGVLMPMEVAKSRFGGDYYGQQIQLDEEARAAYEEQLTKTADVDSPDDVDGEDGDGGGTAAPPAGGLGFAPFGAPASAETSDPTPRDQAAAAKTMADIVAMAAEGKIPPDSAVKILVENFEMPEEAARAVVAAAGKGFKYKPPEPKLAPGAGKPGAGKPGAKPAAKKPSKPR